MATVETDAFSVAQMQSKLWLVERLERVLEENHPTDDPYRIWILAGWYGLTNLILRTRNKLPIMEVRSFDIDPQCETIADSINNLWVYRGWEFKAVTGDINTLEYHPRPDIVINSSCEHMKEFTWWYNIPEGTIVCLQGSDMDDPDHWMPFKSTKELMESFPLQEVWYDGIKRFEFEDKGFYRSMIIGVK
jgi:hypothetical protein